VDFYTSVDIRGKNILYRGWKNGQRQHLRVPFCPTLYIPSKDAGEFTTINGKPVQPIQFDGIGEAREFIDRFKDVSNYDIYGNTNFVYQYLYKEFPNEVDYDFSSLRIANLDIETSCDGGFPTPSSPTERVIAITISMGDKTYVLGLGDFHIDGEGVSCIPYDDEQELLAGFIELWRFLDPDIVTGWNIRFFDIPYLVARMNYLEEGWGNSLSPWGKLRETVVNRMGRDQTAYVISGVATLDYFELYQTFTYVKQESYSLNHISKVELGEEKLSYAEYETIQEFYTQNFQRFMEYNFQDVRLVDRLESKLKLMELAVALAYSARVNFEDVFSQVRTWDAIIHHHLMSKGMVIPQKTEQKKDDQYAGAYVMNPIVGKHDWVVSFDLNSLYPHLIMQYNISPETKHPNPVWRRGAISPESMLARNRGEAVKDFIDPAEYLNSAKADGVSVAANGVAFVRDRQGFLPELMEKMYAERKHYKSLMIAAQKRLVELDKNAPAEERRKIEYEISKYHNFQLVRKIQLNSAYGAIGNQYFRFFDVALAEAITLSGQLNIQWIGDALNRFLNRILKTEGEEYVIYMDTDSVYLRLGKVVDSSFKGERDTQRVVDFLNGFCERVVQPQIEREFATLADSMNAYTNKMVMGREVIAEAGVWTAKKRYMLSVWDSEGVRYKTPKFKIMGIETARSSTPAYVRKALKTAIEMVLMQDEATLQEFVRKTEREFKSLPVEEVASPRGVNGMEEYSNPLTIYKKGTPIAVKAALLHNHLVKKMGLSKKYRTIGEGEKMKFIYLKTPNPIHEGVIGFPVTMPKEFDLQKYIDYDTQFKKTFLEPLRAITDAMGWSPEERNSLESLFA
jgi:DNA polymerase elongation subunit (family B)